MNKTYTGEGLPQQTATSFNDVPNVGVKHNIWDMHMGENEIDRALKVINGGLDALLPSSGTARELTNEQREACKFGLEICDLILKRVNFFRIGQFSSPDDVRSLLRHAPI